MSSRVRISRPCRPQRVADLEERMILCLRLWGAGAEGQARVWSDLAGLLGPARGRAALKAFERYAATLAAPLGGVRAGLCLCSAAEMAAAIVGRAAEGDGDTAARLCRHLAPGAAADEVVATAGVLARHLLGDTPGAALAPAGESAVRSAWSAAAPARHPTDRSLARRCPRGAARLRVH